MSKLDSDRKQEADALLVEAIIICRALAAEFPDNANYKNRLAALLKLQAQHFGQRDMQQPVQPNAVEQPN